LMTWMNSWYWSRLICTWSLFSILNSNYNCSESGHFKKHFARYEEQLAAVANAPS
jgi:hypothetical protein